MEKTEQIRRIQALLRAEPTATLGRLAGEMAVEAHLVGGAVRDALLGRESHDFDVVVSGRGRELAEGVARERGGRFVALGGKEFAACRVVKVGEAGPEWELDVWDREGGSLRADLARRDFTVNAIAVVVVGEGVLVDPFGGGEDLAGRRLRATTGTSFSGDPLRVLRLARFLAQLDGFAADAETVALAREAAPGLVRVASERVRDELEAIFRREGTAVGLAGLIDAGVYPSLWLGEPGAPVEEAVAARAGRAVGTMERLPARAEEVAELAPDAPAVELPAARWATTFGVLVDAATGSEVGGATAAAGADGGGGGGAATSGAAGWGASSLVEPFRDRGYLTRERAAAVATLLAEPAIPADELGRRRFLHRLGAAWPTATAFLGAGLAADSRVGWRSAVRDLAVLLAADGERILDPPRLLSGEDVQSLLALPAGPAIGQALAQVRQAQVDGRIETRGEAEALLTTGPPAPS